MKRERFPVERIIGMLRETEVPLPQGKSQNLRASMPREPLSLRLIFEPTSLSLRDRIPSGGSLELGPRR